MSVIKSGSNGNVADVNSDGQLLTRAVTESDLEFASETNAVGYSWSSSYSATGGQDIISVMNTSAVSNLIIDEIIVGSSVANVFTLYKMTAGTPAGTTVTGLNLNLGSGNTASASAFGNASVTGITSGSVISYAGVPAASEFSIMDTKSGLVMTPNSTIYLDASTTGTVYVTIIGHYK